jgi:hypothetical protein
MYYEGKSQNGSGELGALSCKSVSVAKETERASRQNRIDWPIRRDGPLEQQLMQVFGSKSLVLISSLSNNYRRASPFGNNDGALPGNDSE